MYYNPTKLDSRNLLMYVISVDYILYKLLLTYLVWGRVLVSWDG